MSSAPPRMARWLLLLIPASDREFIEGDLEEEYADRLRRGRSRADAWYWSQVLATVPPVCAQAALDLVRHALIPASHPRRIPAMATPLPAPTSSTHRRPPAFGAGLLASAPPRDRHWLSTNLVSAVLHCSIVGGMVFATTGQEQAPEYEEVIIDEMHVEVNQPPPPPPPPVEEVMRALGEAPPILVPPDVIPPEIPPAGDRAITAKDIEIWTRIADADTTRSGGDATTPIGSTPSFTPYTLAPAIRNRDAVGSALQREYPPLLRDAGVGGRVEVWVRVDERGVFQDAEVNLSSGHPALDEAALRVARIMEFNPAMNRDKAVPVWVSIPITFQVR